MILVGRFEGVHSKWCEMYISIRVREGWKSSTQEAILRQKATGFKFES